MLSDEFRAQHLPRQAVSAMRKVKAYSNHVEVKIDPGTVYHYDTMACISLSVPFVSSDVPAASRVLCCQFLAPGDKNLSFKL
jgi:hypothetical protein